jgi:hypothetical protein
VGFDRVLTMLVIPALARIASVGSMAFADRNCVDSGIQAEQPASSGWGATLRRVSVRSPSRRGLSAYDRKPPEDDPTPTVLNKMALMSGVRRIA